jgi:urease accessory protein
VRATTVLEVGLASSGASVLRQMQCEVPLVVRVGASSGGVLELLVVNGAAGPLGGDEFDLSLTVGEGAAVRVRSVAATMAQPGPHGDASIARTRLVVGDGARLDWQLEPTVCVRGSVHTAHTHLVVHGSGTARVTDAVWLGRHGEAPGRLTLRQRLEVDGPQHAGVVLDHATTFGTEPFDGPGAHGPWRWARSELTVGDDAAQVPSSEVTAERVRGVFPLAPRCALVTASGCAPD